MARDWSTLSSELLLQIMQQLPQEDRLCAGLCCSSCRAAANSATDSVQLLDCDEARALELVPWLHQHGGHVISMQIKLQEGMQLGKLPCNNLRELIVGDDSDIHLPLLPPAAVTSLTKLSLQLDNGHWASRLVASEDLPFPERQLLQELRPFTQLQHLCLGVNRQTPHDVSSEDVWDSVQHLQHLTQLEIHHIRYIMGGCNAQISRLTNLHVLVLNDSYWHKERADDVFDGWQHLKHLTVLKLLLGGADDIGIFPKSTSSLGRLTGLRTLHLGLCDVELEALSALKGLHTITLHNVYLSPATLLQAWLRQQQQLTHLCLKGPLFRAQSSPEFDVALFGCITASTSLRVLNLQEVQLPKIAWPYLFPANRLLLHLEVLQAPSVWSCRSGSAFMDAANAAALAQSCPALQVLEAGSILRLEPQLSSLQHLTRLDVIRAPSSARDDKAAAATLAALHRLRELRLTGGPGQGKTQLSKPMANALTQLTGLVRLEMPQYSLSEQQLSSLCGLTRLTHLAFRSDQLGVLLLDRLGSLCNNFFNHHALLEFAPGKVPQDGPSELTQRLLECFTCNHKQVQQKLTSLQRMVAQQQQQITVLTAHKNQLTGALKAAVSRQRNSNSTQLWSQMTQQQPGGLQGQQQQQEQEQEQRGQQWGQQRGQQQERQGAQRQQQQPQGPTYAQQQQQQQLLEWYEQKLAERDQEVQQLREQLAFALQQQQHSPQQQQQHSLQQQQRQSQAQWAQQRKQWAQQQQQLAQHAAAVAHQQQRLAQQMAYWQAELLPADQGQQQGVAQQLPAQGAQQTSAPRPPPPAAAAAGRQALGSAAAAAAGSMEPMSDSDDDWMVIPRRQM